MPEITRCFICRHENSNGFYRTSSYFFAKITFDFIPLRIIPMFIYSCVLYFMVGECSHRCLNFSLRLKTLRKRPVMYLFAFDVSACAHSLLAGYRFERRCWQLLLFLINTHYDIDDVSSIKFRRWRRNCHLCNRQYPHCHVLRPYDGAHIHYC